MLSCLRGNRAEAAEREDEVAADSCVKRWAQALSADFMKRGR